MARVQLENVGKRYGDTVVADGISLTVADGEFFTLLGPSGCGKSSLLHIVAGIVALGSGRVLLDGDDVTGLPPQKRDVAMVFQSYALYPHLDAYENIAFPLRARGMGAADARPLVERVAASLGPEDLLRKRPGELSGGQRQRVALGRALVRRPRVFLMDEPLSNLDAALRLELRAEIKRGHREYGITTLYVTHDQEEAMVLSGRVAVLRGGRVLQCDTPAHLYAWPADAFVACFVGMPPMNLLPGGCFARLPGLAAVMRECDPDAIRVGVRPEDVSVRGSGAPDALEAVVTLTEATGPHTWVTGRISEFSVKGRLAVGERVEVGRGAFFAVQPWALHLFDARSGTRLVAPSAGKP